ncbi:hypothetical protein AR540_12960 [Pseudomonas sp. EpS/L25]|nr:hypothetical protein AR540_12960 [Pseudomonas sp. EpS/L25]
MSFNATSLILRLNGEVPLAPTALVKATILFAVYLAVLFAGWRGYDRTYRIGMALFVLVLPVIGIIPHVQRGFLPDLYHSQVSWAGAIAINSFGITVSAIGAIIGARRTSTVRGR